MKCGKCGEEVLIQPGKSANFCYNCGNKIEAEKSGDWKYFDNTKELLVFVAAEYGNDALFGRKYFTDHSSPMLPQGQKNLVKQAFDCGAVKILQENVNSDQARKEIAVKQAVKKLTDLMFSQEAAERVIWEFTNAIGWGMPEPLQGKNYTTTTLVKGGAVAPPPPHPPGDPKTILMKRGWQSAELGEWDKAYKFFDEILNTIDPDYAPAFLGQLCVDLKCPQEDKLANVKDPSSITNHKYYKFAVADPTVKARVDGYVKIIKDRIDAEQKAAEAEAERKRKAAEEAARRKRVQDAFDNACKILNIAQSSDDYREAITAFSSIDSNYQDISSQIKGKIDECERKKTDAEEAARRKRVQDAFDNACKIMNNAQSPDDYRKAIIAFGNIDSNYQDISSYIRGNVAQCERNMQKMVDELEKALAPLREKFAPKAKAEKQAKLQELRKADRERIDMENTKTKADVEAKCSQIRQKFDADHKTWQEEYNRLKAVYDTEYKKWETETSAIKEQVEIRKSQGLCPHCCGTLKGLFVKKCTNCGKLPSEPIKTPPAPEQPDYPAEPKMLQMPTFTPNALDESKYVINEYSDINQHVTFAGIEWRILDIQGSKLLLISEKILEKRPYNVEQKNITWENCTLRKYLNGEFLNKLGAIKSAIAETRNGNPDNPWYGTAGGNATTDKVFLLSLDEVCRYVGDSSANLRKKGSTGSSYFIDDLNNSARIAYYGNEGALWWWLRSPGCDGYIAVNVDDCGRIYVNGNLVKIASGGIRPALWLNL